MLKILGSSHATSAIHQSKAEASLQNLLSRQQEGFLSLTERPDLLDESVRLATEWRQKIDDLFVVGIGGSSLGGRALAEIFGRAGSEKRIHFCDSTDPTAFDLALSSCGDFKRAGWLFVSKSGSTIEPMVLADFVLQKYQGLGFKPLTAVISERRSNVLTDWARANAVPVLEIPVSVGGRYSILSPVGLMPLAFLGADAKKFLAGAAKAKSSVSTLATVIAQSLQSFERGEWISLFWFYSSRCDSLGAWLQQLWAESLAKQKTLSGQSAPRVSTPMTAIGPRDQHSILQQVMDGARDKFIVFLRVAALEARGEKLRSSQFQGQEFFNGHTLGELIAAQAKGTEQALQSRGLSTLALQIKDLDEECLGFFFMFWEMVVAGLAGALDINAFDQPSVELGKRLAKEILKS
jgi:glucose-6-phosphate isomerase